MEMSDSDSSHVSNKYIFFRPLVSFSFLLHVVEAEIEGSCSL